MVDNLPAYPLTAEGRAQLERELLDDLVGSKEIAEYLGVTKGAVYLRQVRDPSFPKPVKRLSFGPVFRFSEIKTWATNTA